MNEAKKTNDGISFVTINDVMKDVMTQIGVPCEDTVLTQNKYQGISSSELDTITSGFTEPGLIVLASRPALGKTSLALTMLRSTAVEKNIPSGFFSLEMDACHLGLRLLAQEAMIPHQILQTKQATSDDFPKLNGAAKKLSNAPIYLNDSASISITDIYGTVKNMVSSKSVKAVFIDYLGLIKNGKNMPGKGEQKLEIITALKNMAGEFGISIIILELLSSNQGTDNSQFEAISEQADTALLLDRESKEPSAENCEAQLHVTKHRNGQLGVYHLLFQRRIPIITRAM